MSSIIGAYTAILQCLSTHIHRSFRLIPPFGSSTIRKIYSNRSELKKLTAHDYEDMLQVTVLHSTSLTLINAYLLGFNTCI